MIDTKQNDKRKTHLKQIKCRCQLTSQCQVDIPPKNKRIPDIEFESIRQNTKNRLNAKIEWLNANITEETQAEEQIETSCKIS